MDDHAVADAAGKVDSGVKALNAAEGKSIHVRRCYCHVVASIVHNRHAVNSAAAKHFEIDRAKRWVDFDAIVAAAKLNQNRCSWYGQVDLVCEWIGQII